MYSFTRLGLAEWFATEAARLARESMKAPKHHDCTEMGKIITRYRAAGVALREMCKDHDVAFSEWVFGVEHPHINVVDPALTWGKEQWAEYDRHMMQRAMGR